MCKKYIATGLATLLAATAQAAEFKVGEPTVKNGMTVEVLYIQAVSMSMEPDRMVEKGKDAKQPMDMKAGGGHGGHGGHGAAADIHLEAAIKATAENKWGFKAGDWVPYLNIRYSVAKNGSYFRQRGQLIPMASNGGPHYGANLKLDGPGKYHVTYRIDPPDGAVFPFHMDKETGVEGWWSGFEVRHSFTYLGAGKKGGY